MDGILIFCCSWIFVIYGLFVFFQRARLWRWRAWWNRASGITNSVRTPEWDRFSTISGITAILLGLIGLLLLILDLIIRLLS